MELKEYIKIIKENANTFIIVVVFVILGSLIFFSIKSKSYITSLTINITRKGIQETQQYKYDDYYRLQADEKFSETIVQWLKSPRIVYDILEDAKSKPEKPNLKMLSRFFRPEKLSSQVISVTYSTIDRENAKNISSSISKVLSANIENLNKDQNQSNWFKINPNKPIVMQNSFNLPVVLFVSLICGIFLAFWVVLFIYYIK